MSKQSERRSQLDQWWKLRLTPQDLSHAGLEMHETGVEAGARDRAYVQNAYATLSTTREIVMCGAWAGFQTGLVFLAVVAIVLVALAAFAQALYMGSFAREAPPFVDALAGILRPLLFLLPTVFFFALNGAVAALMRRLGSRRRQALDHYFEPVRPLLDMLSFWLLTALVVTGAVYVLDLVDSDVEMVGLLFITFTTAAGISWPCFVFWQQRYLPLIRRYGSASFQEIFSRIQRQV